ncbi:unnamed protein product [Phytomonas sp. Hart1]|nr:unnamed protein product [Phytomonas sp. Hart1]|eukprot:CCW67860.1 unnamed protein product [Phytomonas sp. isolate Hart1]
MQQQTSTVLFCQSYSSQQEQQQQMQLIDEVNSVSNNGNIIKNIHNIPPLNAISSPIKEPDPKNLIVNYIPTCVTDDTLRELFSRFGTLVSARVIVNRNTKHPKGYGFVKYTTEEAAKMAMVAMNGYEIENKRLRVMQANGPQNRNLTQNLDTPTHTSPPSFTYPHLCTPTAVQATTSGLSALSTALPVSPLGGETEFVPTPHFFQPTLLGQPCAMLGSGGAIYLPAPTNLPTVMLAPANPPSPPPLQPPPLQPPTTYPAYFPGQGGVFLLELDAPGPGYTAGSDPGASLSPVRPFLAKTAPTRSTAAVGPWAAASASHTN